jgi:hypothetical protein
MLSLDARGQLLESETLPLSALILQYKGGWKFLTALREGRKDLGVHILFSLTVLEADCWLAIGLNSQLSHGLSVQGLP